MSASTTFEVQLAIYDLSRGMARTLSAQILGPQHAVEIIPHTAIIAYGKEYFFGQGIERCSPHEFRATRGIHPIEIQPLGRTARTERQFEEWCRDQSASGLFGAQSYDFFHRNCNNFSDEAARRGLSLQRGVPGWILELPQKFLSSPMGMALRPLLEQMQMSNLAPTNVPVSGGGAGSLGMVAAPTIAPSSPSPVAAADAANPWANIPAATSAPATQPKSLEEDTISSKAALASTTTPMLDNQTALLSTDTGVVKICVARLKPERERCELLSKLANANAVWNREEIVSVHRYLRSVIENDAKHTSFALMLLRLVVLRQPSPEAEEVCASDGDEQSRSTQYVANLIIEDMVPSPAARSMAWCVLSNAMGVAQPLDWTVSAGVDSHLFVRAIERALVDCDPSGGGASSLSPSSILLRQSAVAFLYNSAHYFTDGNTGGGCDSNDESTDLSEGMMSILLGCLEHARKETDVTSMQRLYMTIGQLLKSHQFGKTAVSLVKDLGLAEVTVGRDKDNKDVQELAKEVASLLL